MGFKKKKKKKVPAGEASVTLMWLRLHSKLKPAHDGLDYTAANQSLSVTFTLANILCSVSQRDRSSTHLSAGD